MPVETRIALVCLAMLVTQGRAPAQSPLTGAKANVVPAPAVEGIDAALPFPPPAPPQVSRFPGNALIPGSPYAPPPQGYTPPTPVATPWSRHPCLNRLGMACWTDHNQMRCSSLQSELIFIFGSCRCFFGERCMQGPPALPIPNGLGYRSVYPPP